MGRPLILALIFACGFVSGAVVEMRQTRAEIEAATPVSPVFISRNFFPPQP